MSTIEHSGEGQRNNFLRSLPAAACEQLHGRTLTKPIRSGEILYSPDSPLLYLIFPNNGVVSLLATMRDGRTIEEASVGSDGIVGVEYFLGQRTTDYQAAVTIAGHASWIAISDFEAMLSQYAEVRDLLQRHLLRLVSRLRRRIICASVHPANQRMATWLLRTQDRTGMDQFELTQRTLAGIFGLRLATISDASSRLSAAGAIDQSRGTLTISDRALLENSACECYGWLSEGITKV